MTFVRKSYDNFCLCLEKTSMKYACKRVFGLDFSGAQDAGKRIWLASGTANGRALYIDACLRLEELPEGAQERDPALKALRRYFVRMGEGVVGLDFPFGLSQDLMCGQSWEQFLAHFNERYPTPEIFRLACCQMAGGIEKKRRTDAEAHTPFSPYNRRLYRQTYYGMRDVLAPLVKADRARVLPMQSPMPGKLLLLEICPASTLKRHNLYLSYKGRSMERRQARVQILEWLQECGVRFTPVSLREKAIQDAEGNTLDSIIAAWTAHRVAALAIAEWEAEEAVYRLEGKVYVY
jgi:hypothetical protein